MDQKNTIVKCESNCLFNYNGICDNYVINIKDGKCASQVECEETEEEQIYNNAKKMLEKAGVTIIDPICDAKRGQRAKLGLIEDACDDKVTVTMKVAEFDKPNKNKSTIKDMDLHSVIQNAWGSEEYVRDQMCWYCDNGLYGECKFPAKPDLDRTGKCPRYKSTGGNR